MSLKVGIIGLPNAGKSTLFNALTGTKALVADYAFSTIDANHGVVRVPDDRIGKIAELVNPKDIIQATVEVVDIAGLIRGSSLGEGLGNKFLAHIRDVDLVMMVIRCFGDENVSHVYGTVDPLRDVDVLTTELCLADLVVLEKHIQNVKRNIANGLLEKKEELNHLLRFRRQINEGKPIRLLDMSDANEIKTLSALDLLTKKTVVYVANIAEAELGRGQFVPSAEPLRQKANEENAGMIVLSAKFESDLAELTPADAAQYIQMYGVEKPGVISLVQECYKSLNMVTFFTFGEYGLRAWAIPKGTKAPQAAGMIHTDMERGFIRIEVISCESFFYYQSMDNARRNGAVQLEGKEYEIRDGDIVYVRFKV